MNDKIICFIISNFSGSRVQVENNEGDILRGVVRDISNRGVLVKYDMKGKMKWVREYMLRPDNVVDPPEWSRGKPIQFHEDDFERRVFVDPDDGYYHVFRCTYCGMFTKYLDQHKAERHFENLPIITTPTRRRGMRPSQRPRNLFDEYDE